MCLKIVHLCFQSHALYIDIKSYGKYKRFCSLVCHIILFLFNVPAVLYYGTFASCCAMKDGCWSFICIFHLSATFAVAAKFKNAFIR